MKAWTQLSWTNEHRVLSRTLTTLLNEAQAYYLQQAQQAQGQQQQQQQSDGDFQATWKELERRREADTRSTKKSLQSFKADLRAIRSKQHVDKQKPADEATVQAIKDQLEGFEDKLTAYKSAMRKDFDSLLREFEKTEGELQDCLESSSSILSAAGGSEATTLTGAGSEREEQQQLQQQKEARRRTSQEAIDRNLQLQQSISAIDREIQDLGGRSGGWDPRDHDIFIRIWNQAPLPVGDSSSKQQHYPKKSALCKKLVSLVVDKTDVDCLEHYDWYIQYTELLAKKKVLLAEWKGAALSEKTRTIHSIIQGKRAANADLNSSADATADADVSGTSGDRAASRGRRHSEADAQAMREQIERWRREKAEEAEERLLVSRDEDARERARQQELKRRRQQEARLQLDKWRAQESLAKQLVAEPPKSLSKKPLAIESNHSRDMELARKRREERESKQKQQTSRETQLKEGEGKLAPEHVKRDPLRAMGQTAAFAQQRRTAEHLDEAERRRSSANAHSGNVALSARDLGSMRRATPTWIRQGSA